MQQRALAPVVLVTLLALAAARPAPARAAVAHTVVPGETLWSLAFAHNFTTRTLAVYNGLGVNAHLAAGATIRIPTVAEGAAALAAAGIVPGQVGASGSGAGACARSTGVDPGAVVPAPGLAHIPSPWGPLHLAPAAAAAWNALRADSLARYATDLYPAGPLSAYRTHAQQAYLYCLYRAGAGAPAGAPGTSHHETGTAVDVATPAMRWVVDRIGAAYGWGKSDGAGEWWHVDYVGR
jgi:LysM domain/D-alanyl-D-alanine carboxypeptidase